MSNTDDNGISDGIVTVADLMEARNEIHEQSPEDAQKALADVEPELYGFMTASAHCLAGRLLTSNVDPQLARVTAEDAIGTLLTCVLALRRAQRRLWDTIDQVDEPEPPIDDPGF